MVIEELNKRRDSIVAEISQLKGSLAHLDAVIKMFSGDAPAKPRKVRGEVTRVMLNAMRESGKRMSAADIATAIGLNVDNVRLALIHQRKKGVIRSSQEPGQLMVWEIVK